MQGRLILPSDGHSSRQLATSRQVHSHAAVSTLARTSPPAPSSVTLEDQRLELLDYERDYCSIFRRYSPEQIQQEVFGTPEERILTLQRMAEIGTKLGVFYAQMTIDSWKGLSQDQAVVKARAVQLRQLLTGLGPSFVKAGQVLANRPDIIREDYMNELCILQDNVPSFPDDQAFRIIEQDLGRPLGDIFSSISERPIAAASLGQVYKAVLRDSGREVAVKVQRPGVGPQIKRDLLLFRTVGRIINPISMARLGCSTELVVDEFGEKILEELDYTQEARNIQDFGANFEGDPYVKIPWVRPDLCSKRVIVMEWIDGIRCTDVEGLKRQVDVNEFIRVGVVSGLRQLLEFGLFHGDPHPGNIFALTDGRIAYVDFGNVAEISQRNKETLIDAVVHAVNEDYDEMAVDFIKLGFLQPGTDLEPLIPALERIWKDSRGKALSDFNFRTVTTKFNELVFKYPIRVPERYSLVIRSLLTQEGICLTLNPDFHFLEVAYPYVAKRLLTDPDPSLRDRLIQVLFKGDAFQWQRLEDLLALASEPTTRSEEGARKLDLNSTLRDGLKVLVTEEQLRSKLVLAFTEDNRLHVAEVQKLLEQLGGQVDPVAVVRDTIAEVPSITRQLAASWSDRVLRS